MEKFGFCFLMIYEYCIQGFIFFLYVLLKITDVRELGKFFRDFKFYFLIFGIKVEKVFVKKYWF